MNDELGAALAELTDASFTETKVRGAQWHGGLWKHIESLTLAQASWRPDAQRHCIWDIVRHVVYWRRYMFAWYARTPRPDRSGSWTPLPDPADEAAWAADRAALEETQRELDTLLRGVQADDILKRNEDGAHGRFIYLVGLLTHDSYHTGQIAFLRALQGLQPVE